jgi:hypothetical protein
MPRHAQVVNVLVASPGDLSGVRALIPPLFTEWNHGPSRQAMLSATMWEHSGVPELGDHPQDALDRQLIDNSDLLVAIFWTRIGTATANYISGTIQEIEKFKKAKGPKRVMVYFIDKPIDASPMDLDLNQLAQLKEYRRKIETEGLLCNVPDENIFKLRLYQHLDAKVFALLSGDLPEPQQQPAALTAIDESDDARWPCELTIPAIGEHFQRYWLEMRARGDKYRDEGGRLAARFARALDRVLIQNQFILSDADKHFFREQSHELKKLHINARSDYYRVAVPRQFWDDGKSLAERIAVHAKFTGNK